MWFHWDPPNSSSRGTDSGRNLIRWGGPSVLKRKGRGITTRIQGGNSSAYREACIATLTLNQVFILQPGGHKQTAVWDPVLPVGQCRAYLAQLERCKVLRNSQLQGSSFGVAARAPCGCNVIRMGTHSPEVALRPRVSEFTWNLECVGRLFHEPRQGS